jgi:hypothetical protein
MRTRREPSAAVAFLGPRAQTANDQSANGSVGALGDVIIRTGAPENAVFGHPDSIRAPCVRVGDVAL